MSFEQNYGVADPSADEYCDEISEEENLQEIIVEEEARELALIEEIIAVDEFLRRCEE